MSEIDQAIVLAAPERHSRKGRPPRRTRDFESERLGLLLALLDHGLGVHRRQLEADLRVLAGFLLTEEGRFQDADAQFERALFLEPDHTFASAFLGLTGFPPDPVVAEYLDRLLAEFPPRRLRRMAGEELFRRRLQLFSRQLAPESSWLVELPRDFPDSKSSAAAKSLGRTSNAKRANQQELARLLGPLRHELRAIGASKKALQRPKSRESALGLFAKQESPPLPPPEVESIRAVKEAADLSVISAIYGQVYEIAFSAHPSNLLEPPSNREAAELLRTLKLPPPPEVEPIPAAKEAAGLIALSASLDQLRDLAFPRPSSDLLGPTRDRESERRFITRRLDWRDIVPRDGPRLDERRISRWLVLLLVLALIALLALVGVRAVRGSTAATGLVSGVARGLVPVALNPHGSHLLP
ncbi:MAG: hypothetical protein HY814_04210 [Candidatus Riflebacteria bacterium]|nr:hypothetical protein [Candidatus Riflebacteria bacterium]